MMKTYKRQFRNLSPETKRKISESLKGRKKPKDVCRRISKGLRKYWTTVAWEGSE
ncbi:MAG: hypothetical protein K6A64_07135 [Bacteroidales bacterium]|nr:hypothetical protein [Bacteroidales bacterium]